MDAFAFFAVAYWQLPPGRRLAAAAWLDDYARSFVYLTRALKSGIHHMLEILVLSLSRGLLLLGFSTSYMQNIITC